MYRRLYEEGMHARRLSQHNAGVPALVSGTGFSDVSNYKYTAFSVQMYSLSQIYVDALTRMMCALGVCIR